MSTPDSTPIDHGVKRCTKCGEVKARSEFYKSDKCGWADKTHPWCKPCHAAGQKAHRHSTRANLPEAMKAAAPRVFRRAVRRPDTGCWELHGAADKKGYSRVNVAGHNIAAYHVAFIAVHGDVPRQVIMHSCDNPKCVNPDHLSAGTYHQNNADMWARGRGVGQCKLSDDQVREIRALCIAKTFSQRHIARMFGVTQGAVSNIHLGKTYNWVR